MQWKHKGNCWKDCFDTEKEARIAAKSRGDRFKDTMNHYLCDHCGKWHLTKMLRKDYKQWKQRKRRENAKKLRDKKRKAALE